jgi:hypothetical protein
MPSRGLFITRAGLSICGKSSSFRHVERDGVPESMAAGLKCGGKRTLRSTRGVGADILELAERVDAIQQPAAFLRMKVSPSSRDKSLILSP